MTIDIFIDYPWMLFAEIFNTTHEWCFYYQPLALLLDLVCRLSLQAGGGKKSPTS